jgi:hypothetical protein
MLDGPGFESLYEQDIFSSSNIQTGSEAHPSSCSMAAGDKAGGGEVQLLRAGNGEVRDRWNPR